MGYETLRSFTPESGGGSDSEHNPPIPEGPDCHKDLDYPVEINQHSGMVILPEGVSMKDITATYIGADGKWRVSTRPEMANDPQYWP